MDVIGRKSRSRGAHRFFLSFNSILQRTRRKGRRGGEISLCTQPPPHLSHCLCLFWAASLYLRSRVFLISPRQTFAPLPASTPLSDSTADKPSAHFDVTVGCGSGEHLKWPDIRFALNKYPVTRPKQTHHL